MKFTYFMGIDISKDSFDAAGARFASALSDSLKVMFMESSLIRRLVASSCSVAVPRRDLKSIKSTSSSVSLQWSIQAAAARMVHVRTVLFFTRSAAPGARLAFTLYSPLHLKRSLGLARGKSDEVDAQRIAHHAFLHRHELSPTRLPSASLLKPVAGAIKNLSLRRSDCLPRAPRQEPN